MTPLVLSSRLRVLFVCRPRSSRSLLHARSVNSGPCCSIPRLRTPPQFPASEYMTISGAMVNRSVVARASFVSITISAAPSPFKTRDHVADRTLANSPRATPFLSKRTMRNENDVVMPENVGGGRLTEVEEELEEEELEEEELEKELEEEELEKELEEEEVEEEELEKELEEEELEKELEEEELEKELEEEEVEEEELDVEELDVDVDVELDVDVLCEMLELDELELDELELDELELDELEELAGHAPISVLSFRKMKSSI
jgi:hypothetical protein